VKILGSLKMYWLFSICENILTDRKLAMIRYFFMLMDINDYTIIE
jgi:hypothetical protein